MANVWTPTSLGVKALHGIPVFVEGRLWGGIGFDDCREVRQRSAAELTILKTAAACIGSAIVRQAKDDELRKSEELYRSLFEISSEGIYRWELDRPVSLSLSVDEQAVDLYQQHQPDVTLMDLQMPKLEGAAAIAQIRTNDPDARIIVLTTYDGDVDIYRGLQAGARSYLLKDTTAKELLNAVRSVHQGQREIAPTVALKLAERVDRADALTERELAVLRLLVKVIRSDIANETTAPNFATNHDHPY